MKQAEIKIFLEKYATGQHAEDDHQRFIEWLKTAPINEVEQVIDEYNSIPQQFQLQIEDKDEQLVLQIEKAIDQYQLGKKVSIQRGNKFVMWRFIYRSAAAILVISLAGYLLYLVQQKNVERSPIRVPEQTVTNEALPGGNKARLTLGDGSVVSLDDAGNGQIALQGKTQITKLTNGQLVYSSADNEEPEVLFNVLTTPRGGQFKLTLPDGSNVWLNSASSIKYPTAFVNKERKVEVSGEVYFEIAHNAGKPFLANVGAMDIKVFGTHFNVNAYYDEATIKTTLLQGGVSVSKAGIAATLKPGQQAQLGSSGTFKLVDEVDLDEVMAWKNGYFSFNKADLKTVMRQIARWYDVEITYEGAIPERQFVGKISRNSNASDVLKILQETKVHFRIEGKKIIVTP
jgi:transmembrane sensor